MKHGDPRLTQRVTRLLATKTVEGPNGCLDWTGSKTSRGYGTVQNVVAGRRTSTTVTRLVFTEAVRDLGPREAVHHRCGRPSCVRASHLQAVTDVENAVEMFARRALEASVTYAEDFHAESEESIHDAVFQDREDHDDSTK